MLQLNAVEAVRGLVQGVALELEKRAEPAQELALITQALENIRDAAQFGGLARIDALCEGKLGELSAEKEAAGTPAPAFRQWLTLLQMYLDEPTEPEPPALEQTDDALWDEAEDVPNAQPDNVVDVLRDEILGVQTQLRHLADRISAQDSADVVSAATTYGQIIERIQSVCELLGLRGLQTLCRLLHTNVTLMPGLSASARSGIGELLTDFIDKIITYLEQPQNDETCTDLLKAMTAAAWPQPLDVDQTRTILEQLIEGASADTSEMLEQARAQRAEPDDVSLVLDSDVNADLLASFLHEAPQLAVEFNVRISRVAQGTDVQANLVVAQRVAHTLKGAANLIGLRALANVTHHLEDVLQYFTANKRSPSHHVGEVLRVAADSIEEMIEVVQGAGAPPENLFGVLQAVLELALQVDKGDVQNLSLSAAQHDLPLADQVHTGDASSDPLPDVSASVGIPDVDEEQELAPVLAVPVPKIEQISGLSGELSASVSHIHEQTKAMLSQQVMIRSLDALVQKRRFELESLIDVRGAASMRKRSLGSYGSEFDPLELDQYDELYGATHSYIESVSDMLEIMQGIVRQVHNLESLAQQNKQMNRELQELVLGVRRVPVGSICTRLRRIVRQVSRSTGKQVEFQITGEALLIDSEILDAITDPLMHILRNAVDHGIETPEQRGLQGKPVAGRIELSFIKEGNNLVIRCADDGQGFDLERIRTIALARGIFDAQHIPQDDDLLRVILQPGFSTREKATQISGRGVGMDIVNAAVSALTGTLNISHNMPAGSVFCLRLPVSLVTHHAVFVTHADAHFAVPANTVTQVVTPRVGQLSKTEEGFVFHNEDQHLPAVSLSHLLGHASDLQESVRSHYVLLVQVQQNTMAVMVDKIEKSQEVVIKNLGEHFPSVAGVVGVSVLADARIIPVLDLPELLRLHSADTGMGNAQSMKARTAPVLPKVLIVDDSYSVRRSLGQIVRDAGFMPVSVKDGVEAIEWLREGQACLALVDMEMPRLNGLELTRHIRETEDISALPVIMISSRSMNKHRQQAEKSGVDAYLTKPVPAEQLLHQMHTLLDGPVRRRSL